MMKHSSSEGGAQAAERLPRQGRRGARRAAAVFFLLFLAIQLCVPLAQMLWSPRPAQFGWQMYSVASAAPRFELVLRDGSSKPVDITPYVASLRGDLPFARFLPAHLCAYFPQAAAVRYQGAGQAGGQYQCGS